MDNKILKLNKQSIVIIVLSLAPMLLGLFPYSIEVNFVVVAIANLLFALYYFKPKATLKSYLLIIITIPIIAFSILNSVSLRYPTALISSVSANLLLMFGLIFKPRLNLKTIDIYKILIILIGIIFGISLLSLIFLKTAVISFLGFQLHSFYIILFLFSLASGIRNSTLVKVLIFSFTVYSLFFFVQKGLDPNANISFKLTISLFSLILLALFDYRKIENLTFIKINYSKLKLNISKLKSLIVYLLSILIFPSAILFVALNIISISRTFSFFIRAMSFKAMISSIIESNMSILFGFGPGSTTERFDITEIVSNQIGDGLDDISSVASHSMPTELIYEFGILFTAILSFLFIFKILNLNPKISFLSKLYFLFIYLMANLVFPVISTCVYPMSQSFLFLLIIIINSQPKIINE